MAKGSVYCRCSKCGAEFLRERTFHNRREADSWEAYMGSSTSLLCSDCYRAEQEAKLLEKNVETRMKYRDYKNGFSGFRTKRGSYDPGDKTIIVYVPRV